MFDTEKIYGNTCSVINNYGKTYVVIKIYGKTCVVIKINTIFFFFYLQRQLNAVDFKVSSNLKYVLLISDVNKGFQFTSLARYHVYEIATRYANVLIPS